MPLLIPYNTGTINIGSRWASVYCRGETEGVCLMGHIIYTENPCDGDPDFPPSDLIDPLPSYPPIPPGFGYGPNPTVPFRPPRPAPPSRSPPGQLCFWEGGFTNLVFPIYHGFPWDWISLAINRAELEAELAVLIDLASASPPLPSSIYRQLEVLRGLINFSYDDPGGQDWGGTGAELGGLFYALLLLFGAGDGPICPDDMVNLLAMGAGTGFFGDLGAAFAGDSNPLGTKKKCITIKDSMNPKEGTVTLTGRDRNRRRFGCPPTVDVRWKFIPQAPRSNEAGRIRLRAKKKPGDPFFGGASCWVDIVAHYGSPFDIGIAGLDPRLPGLPQRILTN